PRARQMRYSVPRPFFQPCHVTFPGGVMVPHHGIPQIIRAQVLVDHPANRARGITISGADHEFAGTDLRQRLAQSIEVALPRDTRADKTPHVSSGDERVRFGAATTEWYEESE